LPAKAKYGGGSGEPNDPYLIYDANHMQAIGADPCDWDKCFKLTADVDLGQFTGTEFNIIGNPTNKFTGIFDGNDHTISNFTYCSNGINCIGIFGYVLGDNAEIKNLRLIDPNVYVGTGSSVGSLVGYIEDPWGGNRGSINNCYAEGGSVTGTGNVGGLVGGTLYGSITNCYSSGDIMGDDFVGGLVGFNRATITNCYSLCSIAGSSYVGGVVGENNIGNVSYCYFEGIVSGTGSYSGGIAGINRSRAAISNCNSSGSIHGNGQVGGLAGGNSRGIISDGIVTNCYSTSSVEGNRTVGGLIGLNKSVVENSYSTGSVSGIESVGGLVGINSYNKYGYGEISNCYSTGSVSGTTNVGGLVGLNDSGTVGNSFWDTQTSGQKTSAGGTGKTTEQMQAMSTFTDADWDFIDTWDIGENQTYPYLRVYLPSDINKDGIVNFLDFAITANQWLKEQ
jgi:hypothetical protein